MIGDSWLAFFNLILIMSKRSMWQSITRIEQNIQIPKPPSRIKRIWIWGERCSCTTAFTDLINRNFELDCNTNQSGKESPKCVVGGLPWKHGLNTSIPSCQADAMTCVCTSRFHAASKSREFGGCMLHAYACPTTLTACTFAGIERARPSTSSSRGTPTSGSTRCRRTASTRPSTRGCP